MDKGYDVANKDGMPASQVELSANDSSLLEKVAI